MRPVPPVTPIGNRPAEQATNSDIVHIVPVVLTAGDGDPGSHEQGEETQQRPAEIGADEFLCPISAASAGANSTRRGRDAVRKDAHLSRQEQAQVSQPSEREGRVARRERAPTIVESVVRRLRTHVDGNQCILRCTLRGSAAVEQIWAGAADCILDQVRQKGSQD